MKIQEHIFSINEKGNFELVSYKQIENVAGGTKKVCTFIFERNNKTWVVYWHISGEGKIELAVNAKDITLYEELGIEIPTQ